MGGVPLLLGIDSGQTACKAALVGLDGREVASFGVDNAVRSPRPRWVERDPDELWDQVGRAARGALALAAQRLSAQGQGADVDVLGVGVCGHGDGAYLVDAAGRSVRAAILATDSRAHRQARALSAGAVGARALALTGQVPFNGSPAAVLCWLRENEPEVLAAARYSLFCKDFIRLRLTGDVATDPSEASASFTDVHAQTYSDEALSHYGLADLAPLLPPIRPATDVAGRITAEAAAATGLREGTPVVTGAHDVDAAAIGIGAHTPGAASAILGTFSINQIVATSPVVDPRWQARSFVRPAHWLHMSTSPAGATNLDWVVRRIGPWNAGGGPDPAGAVTEAGPVLQAPDRIAAAPLFLPFLYGAPGGDGPGACWVGARGWHERGDLQYSVLEGICLNHRTHLDALREAFDVVGALRVCGGGARSAVWTQLLADVTGLDVEVTDADEATARGAALLAGVGAGVFADLDDAAARAVHVVRRQSPDAARGAVLQQRFDRYRSVVAALSDAGEPAGTAPAGDVST